MIQQKKGDFAIHTCVLCVFGQGRRVNVLALWADHEPLDVRVNTKGMCGRLKCNEGQHDTQIEKGKETGKKCS